MVAESKQNENSELLQDGNRYRYPLLPPSHPVPAPQIRCTILALYKLGCMYVCMYVCIMLRRLKYKYAYLMVCSNCEGLLFYGVFFFTN